MNKLFVLVGPSAAGKTLISNYLVYKDISIINNLINQNDNNKRFLMLENLNIVDSALDKIYFRKIITSTTRTPRNHESHGIDYYFYTIDNFKDKISKGHFLEYVENFGNFYGTCLESIENSLINGNSIIVLDDKGAIKMKELLGTKVVTIYLDVPLDIMEKRMNFRKDDSHALLARTTNLHIINYKEKADFIIDASNRIDLVLLDLVEIIRGNLGM